MSKAPKPIHVDEMDNDIDETLYQYKKDLNTLLKKINQEVKNHGGTPKYKTIKSIIEDPIINEGKPINTKPQLLEFFKSLYDKMDEDYTETNLSEYMITIKNFTPKQMSNMEIEGNNNINIVDAYSGSKSNARFTDKDWRKHHQDAMQSLWEHTGDGWGISHNANMMKKDYLDTYVVTKPSPSVKDAYWTYQLKDMDKDGIQDVLVYDGPYDNPKSNLRYFNGYGWNQSKTNKFRNKYFTDDKLNKGDFSNDAFLTYYRDPKSGSGYKPPMKRPYDDIIKQFTKVISDYCSAIMKKASRADKLEYNKSGFQSKLKSLCYRYVAIPAVLFTYSNNGNRFTSASIQQLVFAKPDSKQKEHYIELWLIENQLKPVKH